MDWYDVAQSIAMTSLAVIGLYGLWALLRDMEDDPAEYGLCPHCGSRYTRYFTGKDGSFWYCRLCGHRWEVS